MNFCSSIKKDKKKCFNKASYYINGNYYCGIHINQILSKCNITNLKSDYLIIQKKIIKKNINKINNDLTKINKDLSQFYKYKTRSQAKKEYRNLLLKIHPDKCKINNFDSKEETSKLITFFNSLSIN